MAIPGSKKPLAGYADIVVVEVQWGDQDAFGHVNNTVFLRWFEIGRISYVRRLGLSHDATKLAPAPILAAVSCNFRHQVGYPDRVLVGTRVTRVGNKSLTMEHAISSERQGAIVADGTSTVVLFDYVAGTSLSFSDETRRRINEIEATPADSPDGSTTPERKT